MTMGERMERLSDIRVRVEKLEQLVARDESSMLQGWGKDQAAPPGAAQSGGLRTPPDLTGVADGPGRRSSPVLLTAFAGPWPTAWPLTARTA